MKQHPKRKDLVRFTVSIPEKIYSEIKRESQKNDESLSVVMTRFLERYFEMKKFFSES